MSTLKSPARMLAAIALASMAFSAAAADLPALPEGLTASAKPAHMPAFNLPLVAGGTARAEEFRNKVVIARFWATW